MQCLQPGALVSQRARPHDVNANQIYARRQAWQEHLKLVIARLHRIKFGRRSEQVNEMAGRFSLEELETLRSEVHTEPAAPADMLLRAPALISKESGLDFYLGTHTHLISLTVLTAMLCAAFPAA